MTTRSDSRRRGALTTLTACLATCTVLTFDEPAAAQVGPGLGNLDCGDAEYFEPFAFLENDSDPRGTNVAVMIRGYFMTIFAPDSGNPPGEIALYDLSDPTDPIEVEHIANSDTNVFREAHSLPIALIDDKQYIAIQTIHGIQFWDFTDPLAAERIGDIDLPGVNGGDYENVSWQTTWQGRYLYVAGGNQGIYIVDAADPTNPTLLEQVPTGRTGGFRVGPLFALGDYMVISNMDLTGEYAVLDISIPDDPALLSRIGNLPRIYAIAVGANDRIYAAGRDGNFLTHSFADPTRIELIRDEPVGEDQLYAAAQDHFVFLGRQNNVIKLDVTDEENPEVVGQGDLGRGNPDHGQVTPMGNLIFIGNDHGTGSALFCHQRGQDTLPPVVQTTYPKAESVYVGQAARISLMFSDFVDLETVSPESVIVRQATGEAVDGIYTYAFNTLSFGPSAPLSPDTTYEVVLPAGGVTDVVGNPLEEETILRFSTGDSIVLPPEEDPMMETGGAGGAAGSGGTAGSAPSMGGAGGTATMNPTSAAGSTTTASAGTPPVTSPTGGAVSAGGMSTTPTTNMPSGAAGAATMAPAPGVVNENTDAPSNASGCTLSPRPVRPLAGLASLLFALGLFLRGRRRV